jgi:phosphinothricin acetyltransferase
MRTALCTREHGARILTILNEVIATSTALYDYRPRTMEMMDSWFDAKEKGSFPVIGLFDDSDVLVAFGTFGTFRAWPAYKYTVEHSVYVERSNRGKGFGEVVLSRVIEEVQRQGYHNLIAGIDAANNTSIALHLKLGFKCCGTIEHAGFKFGRWIDLQFYQLLFEGTPENPVDG